MKSWLTLIWTSAVLMLAAGCGDEGTWEESGRETVEEETEFVLEYMEAWEESLERQSFSFMEPYYILNTHGYHTERRQHQQLSASRTIERVEEVQDIQAEENEYGEERIAVTGVFVSDRGGEEERREGTRYYYLQLQNDEYKIDAIGREQ
ncbi:TcaA NTF2-like domain-containing protein [Alkalicoccus luteus]|uniref:TcaA protein NTF2-like domain-containing protein n=1 Tax=Alkalicoccus luteus TaxID=1237094 RepID=A0A969PT72_9BACI|nr:hypothetical protein [Alkalicoccus luteus]NJP38893.1 hypothetical protein [Alkalicoccus luteus]